METPFSYKEGRPFQVRKAETSAAQCKNVIVCTGLYRTDYIIYVVIMSAALETSAFKETALLAPKGAAQKITDLPWFGHRHQVRVCIV